MPVTVGRGPQPPNEFHTLAKQLERIILHGPGAKQARVRDVAAILEGLAAQNFTAGEKSVLDNISQAADAALKDRPY